MQETLLEPEQHVLSTLEKDGTRRWLSPKLSKGDYLLRRRVVGYLLIAIFTLLPFVKIGGKPFILLDIPAREFTIFGYTFLPTDTILLAMFMVGLLLSIFLLTALFGRVWCGWACPQTVYMEFLYRPIERLCEGTAGRGGKRRKNIAGWRIVAKYVLFFVVSVYLANTFLAYFVGVERLSEWVRQSPLQRPIEFLVMAVVTAAMMFDFCFFREQLCIIACPYGRFQSVLLDQNSLIVSYDRGRGEPRGKVQKNRSVDLPQVGDCVDCGNCVTTCPTGIDIRDGLQMECINCTQCIDACNLVMKKLGRPSNLIRYSSQSRDRGERAGWLRARTVIYPLLLAGIATAFLGMVSSKINFDAHILREQGNPFVVAEDGRIRNMLLLKLTNRTDSEMQFALEVVSPENVNIAVSEETFGLGPRKSFAFHLRVLADRALFQAGQTELKLQVSNRDGQQRLLTVKLVGPFS